jgi:Periplasmic copper-binding protein (NosD)
MQKQNFSCKNKIFTKFLVFLFLLCFCQSHVLAQAGCPNFTMTTGVCGQVVTCTPFLKPGGVASWVSPNNISFGNSGHPQFIATFTLATGVQTITCITSPDNGQTTLECSQTINIAPLAIINITPTVVTNYPNDETTITYSVCLDQGATSNINPIDFQLTLPQGLEYNLGGNFINGAATINANQLNSNNKCIDLVVSLIPTGDMPIACGDWNIGLQAKSVCTQINGNYQTVNVSNPNLLVNPLSSQIQQIPNNAVIDGVFTIDAPNSPSGYLLAGKNIYMKANSEISVNPFQQFTVSGSTIRGCSTWEGIKAITTADVYVTKNSLIRDARIGVDADEATVVVENSKLEISQIGVSTTVLSALNVNKTTFQGNNTAWGIRLNYTLLSLPPKSNVNNNQFDNCATGISAYEVPVLNLVGNKFNQTSYGINSTASTAGFTELLVDGISQNQTSFADCEMGIRSLNSKRTTVRNNRLLNVDFGIFAGDPGLIFINQNKINSNNIGIWLTKNKFVTGQPHKFTVTQNNIDAASNDGVRIWGSSKNLTDNDVRENNIILSGNNSIGIEAINLKNVICTNKITMTESNSIGISVSNAISGSKILMNNIKGNNIASNKGIKVSMSEKQLIYTNSIENTEKGIQFTGMCPSKFQTNKFNKHNYGLYLDDQARIGLQPDPTISNNAQNGNRWEGTYKQFGAFYNGNDNGYQSSRFYIDASGFNQSFQPTLALNQTSWFFSKPGLSIFLPATNCEITQIPPITGNEDPKGGLFSSLIDGTLFSPAPRGKVQQWVAEKQFYIHLDNINYQIGQDDAVDTYLGQQSSQSARFFHQIDKNIAQLYEVSGSTENEFNTLQENMAITQGKINILDSVRQYKIVNNRPLDTDYWSNRRILVANFMNYKDNWRTIQQQLSDERSEQAVVLQAMNNEVITNELHEWNEREVNNVILSLLISQDSIFNEQQEERLTHIAFQCPEDGGTAVFEARAILAEKYNYRYDQDCSVATGNKVEKERVIEKMTLAPNPVQEQLNVFLSKTEERNGSKIVIQNLYGQIMQMQPIQEGAMFSNLIVNGLSNGTYFCILLDTKGNIIAREKFIKIN